MVKTVQVTLGTGATQISPTTFNCRQVIVQNNGDTNSCFVGDSTVTTSLGIEVVKSGGMVVLGPFDAEALDLAQIYIAGTQSDTIDVLAVQ